MLLPKFTLKWWTHFIFPLLFIGIGWCLLPYPGLHHDEVLFAMAQFHLPGAAVFEATIFQHAIPVMFLTYPRRVKGLAVRTNIGPF